MTFIAPAFLGDAEQSGRWRTPPIKALFRQWWRVAYSAERGHRVDVSEMRLAEHALFGTVDSKARRSEVRLRLSRWDAGCLTSWNGLEPSLVQHKEVKPRELVGPHLYLGYGPLTYKDRSTSLKQGKRAIGPGESAVVSLAIPAHDLPLLAALDLMHLYGTIGGRSRNGWGSFTLLPDATNWNSAPRAKVFLDWETALALDWPHAVGADDRPLIWQTPPCPDWKTAMRALAQVKIGLRTQFKFTTGRNAPSPERRHWLAYPVTNHDVAGWKRQNLRLPNTLRFKLRTLADGNVVGVVFHMPCRPPDSFLPSKDTLVSLWRDVHSFLDNDPNGLKLQRIPH
jgi:CRISPR-associated protein Cmr1